MVLAISLVIILLSTLKQVTSALPIILLRSAKANQGKNFSIKIFAFLLLLLIVSNSPSLHRGGRYGSFTKYSAFLFAHFTILQRPLLWGRLRLVIYLFINRLQLFLTSFFRVFFSQFLISLYYLLSSGLQLLIYFFFTYYQLVTRTVYYIDHIYHTQGLSFKTKQYFFSLFLIATQILSSLQLISLGVANKPYLVGIRWISFRF